MAVFRVEWTLLILVILKIAFSSSEETCKKQSVCSCELSNGQTINLKPLDGTATDPGFTNLKSDGSDRKFDWNPCTPFKKSECNEDHVLVAQLGVGECYPAGTDDTSFSMESTDVVVTYGRIENDKVYRSTKITLKCDTAVKPKPGIWTPFKEQKETGSSIYSATYTSSGACPTGTPTPKAGGLSTGSILLIIYFIVGVLLNRFGRGIQPESMRELIPNYSFWADFPFLVKDGVVFTCGCIKTACLSLYWKCSKDGYAEI